MISLLKWRDETLKLFRLLPSSSRRSALLLLFLSLLASLFEVLTIGSMFPIILSLTDTEQMGGLSSRHPWVSGLGLFDMVTNPILILLLFAIIVVAGAITRMSLIWQTHRFAQLTGTDIAARVLENLLNRPFSYHISNSSGQAISLVTHKISIVVNQVLIAMINIFSACLIACCVMALLFYVNLTASLILLSVLSVTYLTLGMLSKRVLYQLGKTNTLHQAQSIATVQESIGHIRETLLAGMQGYFLRRFKFHTQQYRQAQSESAALTASKRHVVEMIVFLMMTGFIYVFLQSDFSRQETLAILGVYALAAQRLLPVLHQIYASWANLANSRSTMQDLLPYLSRPSVKTETIAPLAFTDRLSFHSMTFRYPGMDRPVFENLSLEIFKGQRIGLIGPSGAGKTTLADLICGLLTPQSGFISIDGKPLDQASLSSWQRNIAYVPQHVYLSDQTIAANIAFDAAQAGLDMARVIAVATATGIDAWIQTLPKKYETNCGENGVYLSGGQRQRLGIARALYAQKPVLVLDEPTSALDLDAEDEVVETLLNLDKQMTILVITHRHTLIEKLDCIYSVQNKTVKISASRFVKT